MAGTIALVPKEYTHAKSVGLSTFLVNNLDDVEGAIRMISLLSVKTKEEIISSQEQALRKIVDIRPEYRVDVIESVAKGTFKV
jgi:hypothetical protein